MSGGKLKKCHGGKSSVSLKSRFLLSHTLPTCRHHKEKEEKEERKGERRRATTFGSKEAVDRQERRRSRIFEAWTHGFDEDGVLFYTTQC